MYLRKRELGLEASINNMISTAESLNHNTATEPIDIGGYYETFLAFERLPEHNRLRKKYSIDKVAAAYQTIARSVPI